MLINLITNPSPSVVTHSRESVKDVGVHISTINDVLIIVLIFLHTMKLLKCERGISHTGCCIRFE
jgi:hypothetical protein